MTKASERVGTLRPLWFEAAAFSAWAHRNEVRKDGRTPYAAHPARVALTVLSVFKIDDDTALAAAFLHDVIEDTACDYDDVADRFGTEVAEIVAALTKNMILPEREREREYDERLARADWRARLIKLADAYDNLLDVPSMAGDDEQRLRDRTRRAVERAERALSLAERDPELDRARAALRAVLRDAGA